MLMLTCTMNGVEEKPVRSLSGWLTPMAIKVPTLLLTSNAIPIQELVFLSSARISFFFGKRKDEPEPEWSKSQTLYYTA